MSGCCSTKNVSCISRAGWSAGKFIDENTCQSSSTSGPSAKVNPKRPKMFIISFFTSVSGWRVPSFMGEAVRVRSMSFLIQSVDSAFCRKEFIFSVAASFKAFILIPTSRFSLAGTLRNSVINKLISPFLLKYLILKASISFSPLASRFFISSRRCSIFSKIIFRTFCFENPCKDKYLGVNKRF